MSCASPSKRPLPSERKRRWKKWALAGYRLGVILAALAFLRMLPTKSGGADPAVILKEAQAVFPACSSLGEPVDGIFPLLDARGESLGWITSTHPHAAKIQGYSGPSEALVVFDSARTVKTVRFLASADTAGHVTKVREDPSFWEQWSGKPESSLGAPGRPHVVTGATLTSEAIARGVAARFGAKGMDQWFPDPLTPGTVAKWYPGADRIVPLEERGAYRVGKAGSTMGTVLRSSRMGVSARGFNGISDVIVNLSTDGGSVLGIGFLGSRDNVPYIDDVREELKYTDGFAGKSVAEVMASNPEEAEYLFVSGASVTTYAVIDTVLEMLRRHHAEELKQGFPWKTSLALVWIALGVVLSFGRAGWKTKARLPYAVISVGAGVTLGWMLSQDQLLGWGADGVDPKGALPLLVLTAVAMMVPAFTGKNIYCTRICPHGAAQTLAGAAFKKRFSLPRRAHAIMERVPWLTLVVIWALAFLASGVPLAYFEPFETWSSGFVALVPATIFTVGLIAAFFLPQAYCHYGCPTGALLKFLTHAPGRWTLKDSVAGLLLLAAATIVVLR
jgi:NosR/NirI family nitrous oxide reductase transcriptional regulator